MICSSCNLLACGRHRAPHRDDYLFWGDPSAWVTARDSFGGGHSYTW